jgi:hydroxyethylthiazole kinase-like uncharacterized protein yjeF
VNEQFAVTREQARELDSAAIDQYGVKGLILMENAGRACAEEAAQMLAEAKGQTAAIFCGAGNNGGDGFVIARHLANRGYGVKVFLAASIEDVLKRGGDAAVNLEIALNMDIPVREVQTPPTVANALSEATAADIIVDALLGTGLASPVREPYASLINGINALGKPVLAVDLPSGLDCDTGEPLGAAVRAARTVTFVALKRGFLQPGAAQFIGRVKVAEISVPRKLIERKRALWGM